MSENINIDDTFSSSDLCLCSYLNISYPIIEISKVNESKYEFVFNNSSELQNSISNFYNDLACVNPVTFFNSIKSLKGRIHAGR